MNYMGLIQDYNARIHGIPSVKTHGFSHMDWSPKRPDFNPTEHLWDVLENTLDRNPTLPSSIHGSGWK